MPNWCGNTIEIHGSREDIAALRELLGESFDFNKIIPMPPELDADYHGTTGCSLMVVLDTETMMCHASYGIHSTKGFDEVFNAKMNRGHEDITTLVKAVIGGFKLCPECLNITDDKSIEGGVHLDFPLEESIRRFKAYGYDNWYDWRIANWGTKWGVNANCIFMEDSMETYFDTAWSPPEPIYNELAKRFPNLQIHWHYNETGNGFSGNFETNEHFDHADPCECGCSDCMECSPENFDENGNEIIKKTDD